uniref:Sphingomyelin phosphodiesterase 4 n=1 Tax=Schistosoma haematobium TaxID=6185 RepID=A0A095AYG6_SCHHA
MPIDVCLSLPLIDRVKELNNIFARGNLQELHNSVVLVVDNIFGYSCGTEGWALHAVNEADEPHLFGSIREFLSPNGRFLEVLSSRLTLEFPSIYHDFPLWLLSTDSQNSVWSGGCKQPRTHLSLNAFTYYMFAFMCYASYPKWKQELALCDFENSLYRTLFDDYLGFYLYTDPTTVNVMASKFHILRAGLQTPGYQKYLYNNQGVIVSPESSIPHHNIMNRFSRFIVYCFQHWPFDLSFEVVLETWLSSIQPWRYSGFPQLHTGTRFSSIPWDAPLNLKIDNENYSDWLTFVARHYSLYVGLLLLFMERVTKIDLRVSRNAHMVYRVTKVFSQDGFKMLLLNTEKILSEQQQDATLSNVIVSEYQREQSGLWNPVIISTVERVLNCMMITKVNLQSEVIKKMDKFSSDSDGWFDKFTKWLCSFLIFDMDNSDESVNKCIFYLTEGIHSLREFFAIQETFEAVHDISLKPPPNGRIQWDDLSASPILTRPHLKSPPTSSKSPSVEHPYKDNLSPSDFSNSSWNIDACSMPKTFVNSHDSSRYYTKLTPLDRFQIIMGVKRPYVCQQLINREYASTMNASYENRYILTVCKYLENKFTEMMKQHFIRWCSLSGIRGRFARQLLLPSSYPKQHESQSFLITNNPRLSFRFLANYYVLLRIIFLYIFSYFLSGISSPLLYIVCLIVLYLFYEFVITLFELCHEKVRRI